MTNLKVTTDLIENLGGKFSEIIKKWLTKEQVVEVVDKNSTPEYKECCATHEYCDPNQAMIDAFNLVVGRDIDPHSDSDTLLINEAWDLARVNDFRFIKIWK